MEGAGTPFSGTGVPDPGIGGRSGGRRVPGGLAAGRVPGSGGHRGIAGGERRYCRRAVALCGWTCARVRGRAGAAGAHAPAANAAACSESESSIDLEPADYFWVLEESERRARRKGHVEDAAEFARLADLERGRRIAEGEPLEPDSPAADYEVSLSSEGLSIGGVGSNPNSPRSPIASPATPEAYHEDFKRLEICSVEFSNHGGGTDSSAHGAAASHGGASSASRTGARPAASGRGRPPWARPKPPWKADRGGGRYTPPWKAPRF